MCGYLRGIIPLILLRKLEELTGLRTHEMFDYVSGTSTGAILTNLLFVQRAGIGEAEEMYRQLSMQVIIMEEGPQDTNKYAIIVQLYTPICKRSLL